MRTVLPSALLCLLLACGRSEVYGGGPAPSPAPRPPHEEQAADGTDGGADDAGEPKSSQPDGENPDAGPSEGLPVPSACAPAPCAIEVLATGQQAPQGIAVNSTHVYWANLAGDIIRSWPKRGGPVENVSVTGDQPFALAADEAHVYWVSQGQGGVLARAPVTGGRTERLVDMPFNEVERLVAFGPHLYWEGFGDARVARVARVGGVPQSLLTGAGDLSELSVDETGVYFTENGVGVVRRVALDGTSSTLASMPAEVEGRSTAVDAEAVYVVARKWGGASLVCEYSTVARVPKAGGTWTELARHPDCAMDLGLDATHVYWMGFAPTGATRILRVPKVGGLPEVVAENLPYSWRMAVDDAHVYWTESSSGRVARVRTRPK